MSCQVRPAASWRVVAAVVLAMVAIAGCAEGESTSDGSAANGSVGQLLDKTSADGHQLREVPADEAPRVRLEVAEDSDSGWNVHLDTEGFAFAPERVGEAARPGEGHAHLYLDGEKIARLYGAWYYLSASAVPSGEHELRISLNANDHTTWAVDGKPVSDTARIVSTGKADGHHDHDHDTSPSAQPSPTGQADVTVEIEISEGEVSPPPDRVSVSEGDTVRIEVSSDQADALHVHGYDLEADVTPSTPAVVEFTADQPGLFEVETHESGLQLTQLVVE